MNGAYERLFLQALAWTLLLEAPIVATALKFGPWKTDVSWPRALSAAAVPTLLTLPYLWFLGPWLLPVRSERMLLEPLIAVAEAGLLCLLAPLSWRRALAIALLANLVSFLAGEFLPLL